MFITIPKVFDSMGFGTVIGIAFFLLVLFAALTSSIALTESAVSTLQDELRLEPQEGHRASWAFLWLLLGSLSSLGYGPLANVTMIGMQFLDFFDFLTNSVMMPIAAIASCILVSRVIGVDRIAQEVTLNGAPFRRREGLQRHDPLPVPVLRGDHPDQLHRQRVRLDLDVNSRAHRARGISAAS